VSATITQLPARRELAHRASNGIDVRLYWSPRDNSVTVAVHDSVGASFELAADPARALDVFEHPYAYARTLDAAA